MTIEAEERYTILEERQKKKRRDKKKLFLFPSKKSRSVT